MSRIRLLSKLLYNQIAAGEVVERPASVVKELLENAIDSGADEVLCELKGSGKILIRIRDNGCGIEKDDLPLALTAHATSKIYTLDDLNKIQTLGFRGEALASIASVSKLKLTSKSTLCPDAYEVMVEGDEQNALVAPAAHPDGTTVEVCELFFNTPARRRFLKSDRTEFLKIKDTFIRTALSHPEVSFELISDGKRVIRAVKSKDKRTDTARICSLLSTDYESSGISVYCEDPALGIEGMLLPPPRAEQSLSDSIYLFLNGRPIADRMVTHALKEGFFEVIKKSLPLRAVLYLKAAFDSVDVNVHPRKDEVRFHNTSKIHDLIVDSVVNALKKAGIGEYHDDEGDLLKASAPAVQSDYEIAAPSVLPSSLPSYPESAPKSAASDFNIDDNALPAFPEGVSSVIDLKDVSDRCSPVIVKPHPDAITPQECSGVYDRVLKNRGEVEHNISIYKRQLDAANTVSSFETYADNQSSDAPMHANGIRYVERVSEDLSLLSYDKSYYLVSDKRINTAFYALLYIKAVSMNAVERKKLALPFSIRMEHSEVKELDAIALPLSRLGFDFNFRRQSVELTSLPVNVKGADLCASLVRLFDMVKNGSSDLTQGICPDEIASFVVSLCELPEPCDIKDVLTKISDFESLCRFCTVLKTDFLKMAKEEGIL